MARTGLLDVLSILRGGGVCTGPHCAARAILESAEPPERWDSRCAALHYTHISGSEREAAADGTFKSSQPDAANAEGQAHDQDRLLVIHYPVPHAQNTQSLLQFFWLTHAFCFLSVMVEGVYLCPQS